MLKMIFLKGQFPFHTVQIYSNSKTYKKIMLSSIIVNQTLKINLEHFVTLGQLIVLKIT